MICLIPLTSQRASTTFAGVPCTDASHFDLLMIVNPGDWEVTNIISKAKQQGHRRCKYPKKHIIVDESTGDFAIVHGKVSSMAGFKRMRPTLDIVEFFLANGVEVPLPSANEVKDLAEIGKEEKHRQASESRKDAVQKQEEGWELVEDEGAEDEYVVV